MRETDLYGPVKAMLEAQGYEVKSEIGAADVVAMRGEEPPVLVEFKTGFSLALFHQAVERRAISDAVYVAVPGWKGRAGWKAFTANLTLCRRLGLGLMTVQPPTGRVDVHLDPVPTRRANQSRARNGCCASSSGVSAIRTKAAQRVRVSSLPTGRMRCVASMHCRQVRSRPRRSRRPAASKRPAQSSPPTTTAGSSVSIAASTRLRRRDWPQSKTTARNWRRWHDRPHPPVQTENHRGVRRQLGRQRGRAMPQDGLFRRGLAGSPQPRRNRRRQMPSLRRGPAGRAGRELHRRQPRTDDRCRASIARTRRGRRRLLRFRLQRKRGGSRRRHTASSAVDRGRRRNAGARAPTATASSTISMARCCGRTSMAAHGSNAASPSSRSPRTSQST